VYESTKKREFRPRLRGKCPVCGYSVTIRKNGYAERHYLYATEKFVCPGGEEQRKPDDMSRYPIAWWLEPGE